MRTEQIGAAAWGLRELPLEEQLRLCGRLGLRSLEFGVANAPGDLPETASEEEIAGVRQAYQACGIEAWCAATGNDFTGEDVEQQTEKVKKVIRLCRKAGFSVLRIFAGFAPREQVRGERWERMIGALDECAALAERVGITLALETHGGVINRGDGVRHVPSVTTQIEDLQRIFAQTRGKLCLVLDPANLLAVGRTDVIEFYRVFQDRIAYLHGKDFALTPKGNLRPAAMGEGPFDWKGFLAQCGGTKRLFIEYETPLDVEAGFRKSIDYLKKMEEQSMGETTIYDYKTTRAVVIERPHFARLRTISLTEPMPDAYVAKTLYSSISSGTDMKTYKGLQHPEQCWYPLVPGYETAGVVVAAGPETDGRLKPGDRVMINECRKYGDVCAAWGGGSEYTIKDSNTTNDDFDYMVKVPDNVSDVDAVLAYLPCVALKGIRRLSLKEKETVVVVGAGMVGISAVQILKILCPSLQVICVERNETRRSIARSYADIVASDQDAVRVIAEATNGKMADKVIECSGNPQVPGILYQYIKDGGWNLTDEPAHIHLQGDYPEKIIMDSYHRWFVKNCTITMTCALAPGCKEQILAWMSEGKFDTSKLPIEIWPVSKCGEAFARMEKMGEEIFKIVFDWSK